MRRGLICLLALAVLTGCSGGERKAYARELGETAILRTLGVDGRADGVELTVAAEDRDGQETLVLSARGATVAGAARSVSELGDRYLSFAHADQLLLDESAAADGVEAVLDYLGREGRLGLGVRLWVVRGSTAAQVLRCAGEESVPRRLERLETDGPWGPSAVELMAVLARGGSVCLPAVTLAEDGQTLRTDGYALLRAGRLVCFAGAEESRGLELLDGRLDGLMELELADGVRVSLTVRADQARWELDGSDGVLTGGSALCRFTAKVAQAERALTQAELDGLLAGLERQLEEDAAAALALAQYWDADVLALSARMQMAEPARSRQIREQWAGAFRDLDLRVEVRGSLDRPADMTR